VRTCKGPPLNRRPSLPNDEEGARLLPPNITCPTHARLNVWTKERYANLQAVSSEQWAVDNEVWRLQWNQVKRSAYNHTDDTEGRKDWWRRLRHCYNMDWRTARMRTLVFLVSNWSEES
jgi:hypothetical protein